MIKHAYTVLLKFSFLVPLGSIILDYIDPQFTGVYPLLR